LHIGWRVKEAGFTLVEIVIILALTMAVAAVAMPSYTSLVASQRAKMAARAVERELQSARLKAVTSSRPMRVRLNCPTAGQLRVVEVTGVAATDNASNRCSPTAFPVPGPNDMLRSTPSLDSPVVYLPSGTTITSTISTFDFNSRGEVLKVDAAGVSTPLTADAVVTVIMATWSNGITVNALGRIKLG
jgi:Tfp pilus assembly protein FimT